MRRRTAVILLSVAGAAVAVTVLATVAAYARYAAFRPLAHPFLTVFLAAVVAIVAVRGLLPEGVPRLLTQAGIGLLGLVVGSVGLAVAGADDFDPHDPVVVATGPDVQVVSWQMDVIVRDRLLLRLRTRDGLFSRDGAETLACFINEPATAGMAAWTFASASVTGDTLAVSTADGKQWSARFDRTTLLPTGPTIDRCTGAPGYSD